MKNGFLSDFTESVFIEFRLLKAYIFIAGFFIIITYSSLYLVFDKDTINNLSIEDGLIEYLTALFFFGSSVCLLINLYRTRDLIFLVLFFVFFFGAGEEISWGQRIFNFRTPEFIAHHNIQGEFNLHNLKIFSAQNSENLAKATLLKFISFNFLYKLFWLVYCIVLPVVILYSHSVRKVINKIKLPVPPFSIGIFLLINWLIFKFSITFLPPADTSGEYIRSLGEIYEYGSSFLFMLLNVYFLFNVLSHTKSDANIIQ